jgi:hypothetical protein
MTKKQKISVPPKPDWLIPEAEPFWPVRDQWPTSEKVALFIKATRKQPEVRLNLLSALRYFATADMQPLTNWVAVYISVVAILLAGTAGLGAISYWIVGGTAIAGILLVVRLGTFTGDVESRRRHCAVWLAAYENALRR